MVKNTNTRLKYSFIRLAPLILVVYFVIEAFSAFQHDEKNAVMMRNKDYIQDITQTMADRLDDIFDHSLKDIKTLAKLSSNDVKKGKLNAVYFAELEKNVQFDHLRFIDRTGMAQQTSDNTIDSRNQWFIADGMKGNSGIFVFKPSDTAKVHIIFYAPVIVNSDIVGVLSSSFDENTIKHLLEYKVHGATASAGIVNTDGENIISPTSMDFLQSNEQELYKNNFRKFLYTSMFDEENKNKVINAYTTRTPSSYSFKGPTDEIQGYIVPLHTIPLCIYSYFPPKAESSLYSTSIKAGRNLQFLLIIIFFSYIAYLIFVQFLMMRAEARENRIASYIAKAENTVAKAIFIIDVKKGTFKEYSSISLPIPKKGLIDEMEDILLQNADDSQNGQEFKFFFEQVIKSREVPQKIPSIVFSNKAPNGNMQYITMAYIPVEVKKNIVHKGIILFRDVTSEKSKEIETNRRLSQALTTARKASNAKTTFLFNMSHDIRTPMNAVMGFTAMAKKHIDDPQTVKKYLEKIDVAGKQLLSLVNQVLEMSRIETGKIILSEQKCDLEKMIMALSTTYGSHAETKGILFTATITNIEHKYVCIDSDRINQIAANIIGNAIKYTPENGTITCTLSEQKCDREGYGLYSLIVEDTGIGMTPEFLNHIYDEFARESSTTVSRIQGTGLGMTIVKKLTDLMGGSIHIESEKGQGTKITLNIPMKWSSDFEQQANAPKKATNMSLKGMKILLVEDNEMNREIAEELLTEKGIIVDTAADGDEAIAKLDKAAPGEYELILMDVQMPRVNGYDATREIRCMKDPTKSNIPIIAMTANAFEEDKKDALAAGMDGHLAKPIDVQKLVQTLTNFRSN